MNIFSNYQCILYLRGAKSFDLDSTEHSRAESQIQIRWAQSSFQCGPSSSRIWSGGEEISPHIPCVPTPWSDADSFSQLNVNFVNHYCYSYNHCVSYFNLLCLLLLWFVNSRWRGSNRIAWKLRSIVLGWISLKWDIFQLLSTEVVEIKKD